LFSPSTGKFTRITSIQASVGALEAAGYMARQEEGGAHTSKGGGNLAIPTDEARGGNKAKAVPKQMYLRRIKRNRMVREARAGDRSARYGSAAARLVARAYIAAKHGKFVSRAGRSIFRVSDFVKSGTGKNSVVAFKAVQMYNIDKAQTMTQARPWLLPASDRAARNAQRIFETQMDKVLAGKK